MVTVIIAQFTDAHEASNFLLSAIDPSSSVDLLGDYVSPGEALPPPMSLQGRQAQLVQLLAQQRRTGFGPAPLNPPADSPAAAHDMQAMSGAEQDRAAEDAALNGQSIVPPPIAPQPPSPETEFGAPSGARLDPDAF